jgi:BirA family biotin operon repressor/biotin-[acetyl-CoA-carboxylase] ligase
VHHVHLPQTDSTNTAAAEAAASWQTDSAAMPEPILVTADRQTAGRGRCGRTWHSPPGGLYLSVAYPWPADHPDQAEQAPLAAALAVRDAILDTTTLDDHRLSIKWPNDLLLDDGKLAGLLCERDLLVEPSGSPWSPLIVGVGINMDAAPTGPCRYRPAALGLCIDDLPDRSELATRCADRLTDRLLRLTRHGWSDDDTGQLDAALAWRDEIVTFEHDHQAITGRLLGVDPHGRLRISLAQDHVLHLNSGEVHQLASARASPAEPCTHH